MAELGPFFWIALTVFGSGLVLVFAQSQHRWGVFLTATGLVLLMLNQRHELAEWATSVLSGSPPAAIPIPWNAVWSFLSVLGAGVLAGLLFRWTSGRHHRIPTVLPEPHAESLIPSTARVSLPSEEDQIASDHPLSMGWLAQRLNAAAFDSAEVARDSEKCFRFLTGANITTQAAAETLISDEVTRAGLQQMCREELHNPDRILDPYGFCKFGPRYRRARLENDQVQFLLLRQEIGADFDRATGREKTREVQDRELAVARLPAKPDAVPAVPPAREVINTILGRTTKESLIHLGVAWDVLRNQAIGMLIDGPFCPKDGMPLRYAEIFGIPPREVKDADRVGQPGVLSALVCPGCDGSHHLGGDPLLGRTVGDAKREVREFIQAGERVARLRNSSEI